MGISLLHPPDLFALTKAGRMVYTFSGNGRTISAGARAVNQISFTNCPDGTSFSLIWNARTYTYTAKTNPSSDTEFLAGNGSAAYVDALVSFFSTRYEIREAFTVTRAKLLSLEQLVLTAKQPGTAYTLTPFTGITNNFTLGISTSNTTPGVDPEFRSQYGVHAEVWLEKIDGSAFDMIYANSIDADDSGLATFDVGDILHKQFSLDWPSFVQTATNLNPHSARRYYVAYGECFGFPQKIGAIKETDKSWAYYGGADYVSRASGGFPLITFIQTITAATDWAMRFGKPTRYVRQDEPQFLTFLNTRQAVPNLILEVLLTYSDNSQPLRQDLLPATAWPLGSKITMPVGPLQLGLPMQTADQTLREYSVRLRQQGTNNYFSTSYRYILNYKYEPYVRYFAYESSLGVVDTLATFGKGSSELERFYDQAEQFLASGYDPKYGQFVDYNVTLQEQTEVTTGFREASELAHWNDFYRSEKRLQIDGLTALPISIISKSIKQAKDGDSQFAHTFQYVQAYQDAFYTGTQSHEVGDPTPPPAFLPAGGEVIIQPTQTVFGFDATVPQAARDLTTQDVIHAQQAYSWGNHADAGYLNEQTAAGKYAPKAFLDDLVAAASQPATGLQLVAVDSSAGRARIAAPEEVATIVGTQGISNLVASVTPEQADAILGALLAAASDVVIQQLCARLASIGCGGGSQPDLQVALGSHYELADAFVFGNHYELVANSTPTPLPHDYIVFIQENNCDLVAGYIVDRNYPDTPGVLDIFINHALEAIITASNTRPDLASQYGGKATSLYGFVWLKPEKFRNGTSHILNVFASNTNVEATYGQSQTTPACGLPPAPYVVQLVIAGPSSITEGAGQKQWNLTARYNDGSSSRYLGGGVTWSVIGKAGNDNLQQVDVDNSSSVGLTLVNTDATHSVTLRATFAAGGLAEAQVELVNVDCQRPAGLALQPQLVYNYITSSDNNAHLFDTLLDANNRMGKVFNESNVGFAPGVPFKAEMADYNKGTEVFLGWASEGNHSCEHVSTQIYYALDGSGHDTQLIAIQVVDGRIADVLPSGYKPPVVTPTVLEVARVSYLQTVSNAVQNQRINFLLTVPGEAVQIRGKVKVNGQYGDFGDWFTPDHTDQVNGFITSVNNGPEYTYEVRPLHNPSRTITVTIPATGGNIPETQLYP